MRTGKPVVDGRKRLSNDLFGEFQRRLSDLSRRVDDGSLDQKTVMRQIQRIIEGNEPIIPSKKWDGDGDGSAMIYFTITSDGMAGDGWIRRLEKQGFGVTDEVKAMLRGTNFKPTSGVVTRVAVIKSTLFEKGSATESNFNSHAKCAELKALNLEKACLIREMFSDQEIHAMDLYWINIAGFGVGTNDFGGSSLKLTGRTRTWDWGRKAGYAYAVWSSEGDSRN